MPFPGIYPPPLPCEASAATVSAELHAALDAYGASPPDLARFYGSAARASAGVGCLNEPLPRESVAVLYEVQAILAYVQKDPEGSSAFLRGAHATGGQLPLNIASNTPKLADLERAVSAGATAVQPLLAPSGLTLLVDGAPSPTQPTDRPYLLQVLWADGAVHYTGLLPTGAHPELSRLAPPPPPPPVALQPTVECAPCAEPPPAQVSRPRPALTLAALGATTAGAGLYAMAAVSKIQFSDPQTPDADLEGLSTRANALQWSAIGVGAVALGLDVTALVAILRDHPER